MAPLTTTIGIESWAGSGNSILVTGGGSGGVAINSATLTLNTDEHDTTGAGGSAVTFMEKIGGLYSWSITTQGILKPDYLASGTGVTFAAATLRGVETAYTLNVNAQSSETTGKGSGVVSKTFLPGLLGWDGTLAVTTDNTNAMTMPASLTDDTTTFLVYDETSDHTLEGRATFLNLGQTHTLGQTATTNYTFTGDGALTAAGGSDYTPIYAAGALTKPTIGSIVFSVDGSREYSGDAFWTQVSISAPVGEPVRVSMQIQGTGALTPA